MHYGKAFLLFSCVSLYLVTIMQATYESSLRAVSERQYGHAACIFSGSRTGLLFMSASKLFPCSDHRTLSADTAEWEKNRGHQHQAFSDVLLLFL